MMKVGNLQVNTLKVDSIKIGSIKVNTINGVTAEELSYLNGIKDNVQKQLDDLNESSNTLKNLWKLK